MITEHEYQLGGSCPTKILHQRAQLPRADKHDSFAAWMRAESGKLRAFARLLFPSAVEMVVSAADTQVLEIRNALAAGQAVANAALVGETARCRVDMLVPDGPLLRLTSFVAKAVNLEQQRLGLEFSYAPGKLRREWREVLEAMAFRARIAEELFPEFQVVPQLVVPIKGVRCSTEGLHRLFVEHESGWSINSAAAAAEATNLLRVVSVAEECALLRTVVARKVDVLSALLANPGAQSLSYRCKKCEFRVPGEESGFDRCWGPLAKVEPSMFDLAYMYFIQDSNGQPVANRLIQEGRVSLWDIPVEQITGDYAERQMMQLQGTKTGEEIIMQELSEELSNVEYPQFYLDIETLRCSAIPPHQGTGVNELILFQFSIHVRRSPGAELEHIGWLNTNKSAPNRRFLAALRQALGDAGTVFVWTEYEENSFAELLSELIASGAEGEDCEWLRGFLPSGRVIDLHDLCFKHYFHPAMRGRTSIKSVLPAVWSVNSPVKCGIPYSEFPADCDPYAALKKAGQISDGCLAMEGYLDVLGSDIEASRLATQSLERYCYVDTLAMAYIHDYWLWRLATDANRKPHIGREDDIIL